MPRRRLAVALLLPDDVSMHVDGLRRALGDDRTRVAPHITLVPPVNVREEAVVDARDAMKAAAATVEPFDLVVGPAATFHPVTPVVYLAVGGDVGAVHGLRDALLVEPMARPAEHPFVPHVTIADALAADRIDAALVALADFEALCPMRSITLLEDRAPGPHRWNPIAEARLGGRS